MLDNCSSHGRGMQEELKNIQLIFLPANTTSLIQPMDQGIIQNWKCHYKSELNRRMVAALDANPTLTALDSAKAFSLLNAIYLAHESWEKVKQETIINCFAKGGFLQRDSNEAAVARDEENTVRDEDDILADVEIPDNMGHEQFLELVNMDKDLDVFGEMSNANLLQAARGDKEEKDDDDDDEAEPPQTMKEKHKMVEMLRRFIQENALGNPTFRDIEREVCLQAMEKKKQKKIDQFFKKK